MTKLSKIYACLGALIIAIALFAVVLKPVLVAKYIEHTKKHSHGQYICTLNNNDEHVSKLYKIKNGKKELSETKTAKSCTFIKPKINSGFFVFAIGGGGGATPYESGQTGEIISKHKFINAPSINIKIGKGGNGTILINNSRFEDAKDGEPTTIDALNINAMGGAKSGRMTPLGIEPKTKTYHIPEKYHYLYDIPKSAKYGAGGEYIKYKKEIRPNAQNGHNGAVIILW